MTASPYTEAVSKQMQRFTLNKHAAASQDGAALRRQRGRAGIPPVPPLASPAAPHDQRAVAPLLILRVSSPLN